jgi:hypothetical protein
MLKNQCSYKESKSSITSDYCYCFYGTTLINIATYKNFKYNNSRLVYLNENKGEILAELKIKFFKK